MFVNFDEGFPAGTFNLGEKLFYIKDINHRFRLHKKCDICGSSGIVVLNGISFTCPSCKGGYIYKDVIEKVISDDLPIIRSVISYKNRTKSLEYYTDDSSGFGWIIKKTDGESRFYSDKSIAQKICDDYNIKNGVAIKLEEYKRLEIRQDIGEN